MNGMADVETLEYRVLVVRTDSCTVLAVPTLEGHRLPCVSINLRVRRAKALRAAMREQWQTNVLILDLFPATCERSGYATAELLSPPSASALESVVLDHLSADALCEEEREHVALSLTGETGSPFTQAGWLLEATRWLGEATDAHSTSEWEIEPYNAGGPFTLVRFRRTNSDDYWLKATGGSNQHERVVTELVSKLGNGYLPEVVATREDWNAWIMRANPAEAVDWPSGNDNRLNDVVASMAALQRRTVGFEKDLLAAGAFDQRLPLLQEHSKELFDFFCEAMCRQTSTRAPRIAKSRILEIREMFETICSVVERLKIPNAVIHGDMNPGNILVGAESVMFIDWSEAYVGHPFITLEHLLLLNDVQDADLKQSSDGRLKARYREVFQEVCETTAIDKALACMPVLAAASAIYGRGDWFNSPARDDPQRQQYARTLLRHMDRAANDPELLSTLKS